MSNFFDRFQARNFNNAVSNRTVNTSFITDGENSTVLANRQTFENIQAAVVSKPEQDVFYIYTYYSNPLPIGSVWKTNKNAYEDYKLGQVIKPSSSDTTMIVVQEITTIKNTGWNKYVAFPCNFETEGYWGYFIGPEKKSIGVELNNNILLQSKQNPVLVMQEGSLAYGDKIMFKNRAWLVQELDEISSPGVGYYSLRPTTMNKIVLENNPNNIIIEKAVEFSYPSDIASPSDNNSGKVNANKEITVNTEGGYFKTDKKVNIVKHTATEVIFKIPFGISILEVQVKNNGVINVINYEVE